MAPLVPTKRCLPSGVKKRWRRLIRSIDKERCCFPVVTSQRHTVPPPLYGSNDNEASDLPSGESATPHTSSRWPRSALVRATPVATFQTRAAVVRGLYGSQFRNAAK